jgi:hypothetical protein
LVLPEPTFDAPTIVNRGRLVIDAPAAALQRDRTELHQHPRVINPHGRGTLWRCAEP